MQVITRRASRVKFLRRRECVGIEHGRHQRDDHGGVSWNRCSMIRPCSEHSVFVSPAYQRRRLRLEPKCFVDVAADIIKRAAMGCRDGGVEQLWLVQQVIEHLCDTVGARVNGAHDEPYLRANSPMTAVPDTYLCRYFVLNDVYPQSLPGNDLFGTWSDLVSIVSDKERIAALPKVDHLKSRYLVFSCHFHGDLDAYLHGMWGAIEADIRQVWQHCYAFAQVDSAASFAVYMKKCQLNAALFFVGSNDDPLDEQLKALYVKQELSRFAMRTQGLSAVDVQREYLAFIKRVEPRNLAGPAWRPGQYKLTTEAEATT